MARLSRDKKRDHQHAGHPAAPAAPVAPAAPIDVRVPGAGAGTVGGVTVVAAPGEEIQQTVLDRLQGLARAAGRPVLATVHDERIGYVVPLRVDPDGSSHLMGEPAPAGPSRTAAAAPGTVAPPTGEFGPPPRMDGPAAAPERAPRASAPAAPPAPLPVPPPPASDVRLGRGAGLVPGAVLVTEADLAAGAQPTPARGFDAVAEAVLGDGPVTAPGDGTAPAELAEPTARVNEAVREGRTEEAARLAERAVTEATGTLGADHPEVLRLRELSAYIAYLSGDPVRALHTALDVARAHHRAGDAEAAYGTVRSAATAWRAVRDPARGLELGHELIGLWTALTAEEGPAADDMEELESARARMGRLTERARTLAR